MLNYDEEPNLEAGACTHLEGFRTDKYSVNICKSKGACQDPNYSSFCK